MYRFARTYGFIDSSGLSGGNSAATDTLRIATAAAEQTPPSLRRQDTTTTTTPTVKVEAALRDHANKPTGLQNTTNEGPTLASAEPSRDTSIDSKVAHFDLAVDLATLDSILAQDRQESGTRGRQVLLERVGERSPDLQRALEWRLSCYCTTLDEDLDILKRFSSCIVAVAGASGGVMGGKGVGLDDGTEKAIMEWERMCVMVRAAEKVALLSAMEEVSSSY